MSLTPVFLFALTFFFYRNEINTYFSVDALVFILNAQGVDNSDPTTQVFVGLLFNRLRPVSDLVLYAMYLVAGENPFAWWAINMSFIAISASVVVYAVKNSLSVSILGLMAGAAYVTSRFLRYQVSEHPQGVMESLNIIFIVLIFIMVNKHHVTHKMHYLVFAGIAYFGLYFSHDRFLPVVLPLIVYTLLAVKLSSKKITILGIFMAPVILGTITKLLLSIPMFVGTGSTTDLGFSFQSAITHGLEGSAQVLGLNIGPAYLVGLPMDSTPQWVIIVSLTVFLSGLISLFRFLSMFKEKNNEFKSYSWVVFQLLLMMSVFAGALVTIRLEQRWLMGTMALVIIIVARQIQVSHRLIGFTASAFLVGNIVLNAFYISNSPHFFFLHWQSTTSSIVSSALPAWNLSANNQVPIIFIENNQSSSLSAKLLENILRAHSTQDAEIIPVPSLQAASAVSGYREGFIFIYNDQTGALSLVRSPN
jgi:hypothetical protein